MDLNRFYRPVIRDSAATRGGDPRVRLRLTAAALDSSTSPWMNGSAPSFSSSLAEKPASYWALLTNESSEKWREQTYTVALGGRWSENRYWIHCCRIRSSLGSANRFSFPSQPKMHFLGDILVRVPLLHTELENFPSPSARRRRRSPLP